MNINGVEAFTWEMTECKLLGVYFEVSRTEKWVAIRVLRGRDVSYRIHLCKSRSCIKRTF